MNLRWLIFDYIDPDIGLTPQQRAQVRNRVHLRIDEQRAASLRGGRPVIPALLMAGVFFIGPMLHHIVPAAWPYLELFIPIQLLCVLVFLALLSRWSRKPLVTLALRHYGYEVCLRCGYYLKGLPDDVERCPECGAKRESLAENKNTLEAADDVAAVKS